MEGLFVGTRKKELWGEPWNYTKEGEIDFEKNVSMEFLVHYYQTDNKIYRKIFKEILRELVDGKVFAIEYNIYKYYAVAVNGQFIDMGKDKNQWVEGVYWQLGKPLHEQSVETLQFIRDILK